MNNPQFNVTNEVIDGKDMVRITIGSESMLVDTDVAYGIASSIEVTAGMPASLRHIDTVFDGWGDDGGTC